MYNIISVLLIFPLLSTISALKLGQRIGIHRVPYIVHGLVLTSGFDWRFGAIILNENTVLTTQDSCHHREMTDHQMVFGIQNLLKNKKFKRYKIKRILTNQHLCMIQPTTTLEFGPKVQKAVLPSANLPIPQKGQEVYLAGYGRRLGWDFADELHYRVAYIGGKVRQDAYFTLFADPELKDNLMLEWSEAGSPVWDPRTNVVIGLLARIVTSFELNSPVLILANERKWIDNSVIQLSNPNTL